MNLKYSYKFLMFDLLDIIENINITYYRITVINGDDAGLPVSFSTKLRLEKFNSFKSVEELYDRLTKVVDLTITTLEENSNSIAFLFMQIEENLEKELKLFNELIDGKNKITNSDRFILDFKGLRPGKIDFELEMNPMGLPFHSEEDENNDEVLLKLIRDHLILIKKSIKKIILFLKHFENISALRDEKIQTQNSKNDYIKLIKKGKMDELFDKLGDDSKYMFLEEIVQLYVKLRGLPENTIFENDIQSIDKRTGKIARIAKASSKYEDVYSSYRSINVRWWVF